MKPRGSKSEDAKYSKWALSGGASLRGPDYKPFLQVQDFPSRGNANRVKGWKTDRLHHFFSDLEYHVFLLFEWADHVSDVREQFALELSETIKIAEECGYRHSTVPTTREAKVVTTDFVVTSTLGFQEVEAAYAVKPSTNLNSPRELEKLEIEQRYWDRRNIDWRIITERDIPRTLVENIKLVYRHRQLELTTLPESISLAKAEGVLLSLVRQNRSLADAAGAADARLGLQAGAGLSIVWHLIATKQWEVDMSLPLDTKKALKLSNTSEGHHENREKYAA